MKDQLTRALSLLNHKRFPTRCSDSQKSEVCRVSEDVSCLGVCRHSSENLISPYPAFYLTFNAPLDHTPSLFSRFFLTVHQKRNHMLSSNLAGGKGKPC